MTSAEFRRLALRLPEAVEGSHMGHADFRVGGRIFASLGPDPDRAMVKLRLEDQEHLINTEPEAFTPAKGAWGRQGCTLICLSSSRGPSLRQAIRAAWRCRAPKDLELLGGGRTPTRSRP